MAMFHNPMIKIIGEAIGLSAMVLLIIVMEYMTNISSMMSLVNTTVQLQTEELGSSHLMVLMLILDNLEL
jgi:hypothetical protein